jgi:hypothetical protein
MAKNQNIVHQYFKKRFDDYQILVKVNPIHFTGEELTIEDNRAVNHRKLQFDAEIFADLEADGFKECSALEFNLYASGLA